MKLLSFIRKTKRSEKPGKFSDFFLHASEKKKEEVLREAAREANREQREVFERSRFKTKVS